MAISIGPADSGEDEVMAAINTTPLVDVMLVLLIIFLITIPVVTHTVPVVLPKETSQPNQTKPENIVLSVDRDGQVFWGEQAVSDGPALLARLRDAARQVPQPEIQIRGDEAVRYEAVGKVVFACQQVGLARVGFITEPPARGG